MAWGDVFGAIFHQKVEASIQSEIARGQATPATLAAQTPQAATTTLAAAAPAASVATYATQATTSHPAPATPAPTQAQMQTQANTLAGVMGDVRQIDQWAKEVQQGDFQSKRDLTRDADKLAHRVNGMVNSTDGKVHILGDMQIQLGNGQNLVFHKGESLAPGELTGRIVQNLRDMHVVQNQSSQMALAEVNKDLGKLHAVDHEIGFIPSQSFPKAAAPAQAAGAHR